MYFDKKVVVFLFLLVLNINFICCDQTNDEVQVVLLSGLELEHEMVEGQADQPGSNEDFIAIHKDAVGTTEDLNPQMRSLMMMAIQFLPNNYKFSHVIGATREVVAGVRFNLFVNAMDGNESEVICFLDILEKPWITTDFGQKLRLLQYTNCTADGGEFVPEEVATPDPSKYNINPILTKNKDKPITEERLSELESQITTETAKPESETISKINVAQSESQPSPPTINNDLHQQIQIALENLFNTNADLRRALDEISASSSNMEEVKQRYETVFEQLVQAIIRNIFNHTESINDTFSYEFPIKFNQKSSENNNVSGAIVYVEKQIESTSENTEVERKKRAIGNSSGKTIESKGIVHLKEQAMYRVPEIICQMCQNDLNQLGHDCVKYCKKNEADQVATGPIVGGISPAEDSETLKEVEPHAKKAVSQLRHSDGSTCSYQKTQDCTRQIVSGVLYRCTVHHACGGEDKKCGLEIWSQPWLGDPKLTWTCDEYKSHKISKRQIVGNHNELEDLKHVTELAQQETPKQGDGTCELVKVLSATSQVVAGQKFHLKTQVKCGDEIQECEHHIYERAWEKHVETKHFDCKSVSRRRRSHHHIHSHHEGRTYTNKGEEHIQRLFDKFKIKHKRVYANNDEHQRRYKIFKQNLYKIEQLNRMEQGTAKYGITDFADLTKDEYMLRTGLVVPERHENEVRNPMADIMTDLELPREYDWRTKQVVSEVKNQGSCGSCWAFSAVGNIEGQHAIKYGKLESYSEQELVDCDTKDNGCGGGYMDDAFKAIETLGGIELETEYPYSAKREKCHFDSNKVHARVKGAVDLPKNETAIAQFLVQNGPISVGLNANAMQFYRGGVSKPWKVLCGAKNIDHGVLIVGYGVAEYPKFNKSLPYWIIKNSWGPRWGEQGYYRLYRGDNRCGIAEMASSAVIE